MVVIDGPLLQRASFVDFSTVNTSVNRNFSISPEIPRGFAGDHGPKTDMYQIHAQASTVMREAIRGEPIKSPVRCKGVCTAKVHGPGLVQERCHEKHWSITPSIYETRNVSWGSPGVATNSTPFLVFSWITPTKIPGPETIILLSGWLDVKEGYGGYNERNCGYVSGIVEYSIRIEDDILTLESSASSNRVIAVANNTYFDYEAPGITPVELSTFVYAYLVNFDMQGQITLENKTLSIEEVSSSCLQRVFRVRDIALP